MTRNEFLLRLAMENKLAIVSEDVIVTEISRRATLERSEKPLIHASTSHDISASIPSVSRVFSQDTIDSDVIQVSPTTVSTPAEIATRQVRVAAKSISTDYPLLSNTEFQNKKFSISDSCTLPNSGRVDLGKIGSLQSSIQEATSVELFSDCEDLIDEKYISSIVASKELNVSSELLIIPDSATDTDSRSDILACKRSDSERNEEDSLSDDFQDHDSSESEYVPSDDSTSSSDNENNFENAFSNIETLGYPKESRIHKIDETCVRYDSSLPRSKEVDKPILSDVTNYAKKNDEPSTSKNVSIVLGKRCSDPEICFSRTKSPRLTTIHETLDEQYTRKSSARGRPTICPICYQDVITHFTRHLFRHHENNKNVKLIRSLKPGSKERLAMVSALRKQGYFYLNTEKNILNPVRTSKNPSTNYFVCNYCLGHYTKRLLYKHIKRCKNKPADVINPGKNCLTKSQTFMASMMSKNHEYLRTSRIKKEVFGIMRADDISSIAKNDPLICLYGETLLAKHKRQQIATVISNKIREMARMLILIKSMNHDVHGLFDVLKPEMFTNLILATKIISGYDENEKSFKAPSLALHMGGNLKILCHVAFKIVLEKRNLPNILWNDNERKKGDIKDLKRLIEGHWCNEISSLALKTLKEKHWENPVQLPLTSDIQLFQTYLNDLADNSYQELNNNINISRNYKILTECVLALTVMFNRRRVGDVQFLKIEAYNKDNILNNQEAFTESLTVAEKIISKKFKRVVTGGKGSKPVPILFPRRIQKYVTCLLKIRQTTDIVPKSNSYLFANPGSENKWMVGGNVISRLAKSCGAKQPTLLTSTKFRKHIATTLQLMSMQTDEIEQIATFMGHTKKTHAQFYRLPQDVYQTAKVAKVLLLLEKGKGKEFQGKSLDEIELDRNIYYSSESEEDEVVGNIEPLTERVVSSITGDRETSKKATGRLRWSAKEKKLVLKYFQLHLKNKVTPKKHECVQFLEKHRESVTNKDWVRVKTLVYNSFRGT